MNMFKALTKDVIYIVNNEGQKSSEFKAVLSKGTATIFDETLDVDEGDKLIQKLPNDKEKTFTVLDVGFVPKIQSIPAHYKLTIKKDSSLITESQVSNQTTININDSSAIQIGDNNVQNISNSITELVHKIDESNIINEEKVEAKSKIKELLTNPTIASILGGTVSGILGLLK